MARSQANLHTSMFDPDSSLMGCSGPAVLLYVRLLASQDINLCGVLKYQPAALAATTPGFSADTVEIVLDELEHTGHVFVDREIGELMVATFMRYDRALGQAQIVKAAAQQFTGVVSPRIRQAVKEAMPEGLRELFPKQIREMPRDAVQKVLDETDAKHFTPTFSPAVTGTATPPATPGVTPPVTPNGRGPVSPPVSNWRLVVEEVDQCVDPPPCSKRASQPTSESRAPTDADRAGETKTHDTRTHAAAELVARHEARNRTAGEDPVKNLDAWLPGEITRRLDRHGPMWAQLLASRPTLTAAQLAQAVTDPARFETDTNAAGITAAATAEMERNAARARGDACGTCDGAMWLDPELLDDRTWGPARPCPDCNDEARTA